MYLIIDVDECSSDSHSCHVNAVCSNTRGSHTCTCKAGYTGDGRSCNGMLFLCFTESVDVLLCSWIHCSCVHLNWQKWHKRRVHKFLYVSYNRHSSAVIIRCIAGLISQTGPCLGTSSGICQAQELLIRASQLCLFAYFFLTRIDINECASGLHDCHGSASCTNTVGSFSCSCNNPYTGDGKKCNLVAGKHPTFILFCCTMLDMP